MTQNTNTTRTIANLTASILRATGAVRDNYARALSAHVTIDLVSMLVAASDRYQAAEAALEQADTTLANAIATVRKMIRTDTGRNTSQAINAIATGARTYVAALNRGNDGERKLAQTLFIDEINDVTAMMATPERCAEVPTLAFAAMSYAVAEATEIATKEGYRSIQAVIQERATA
jgi:hypothetical protein